MITPSPEYRIWQQYGIKTPWQSYWKRRYQDQTSEYGSGVLFASSTILLSIEFNHCESPCHQTLQKVKSCSSFLTQASLKVEGDSLYSEISCFVIIPFRSKWTRQMGWEANKRYFISQDRATACFTNCSFSIDKTDAGKLAYASTVFFFWRKSFQAAFAVLSQSACWYSHFQPFTRIKTWRSNNFPRCTLQQDCRIEGQIALVGLFCLNYWEFPQQG